MSSRDAVLANIRRSLGVTGAEATRRFEVQTRLSQAPTGVVPARGQGALAERVATFRFEAERSRASVAEVERLDDVPTEVARFLRDVNAPATLRMGADPRLAAMPWSATALDRAYGASDGNDCNAVVFAFGAIAESGTVALVSGPDNPTTLNFLPDNSIVVVKREDVEGDLESLLAKIRLRYGKGSTPRTINLVTGPSRSGDIEQTLLLGAHGPRRLHVVIAG